MRLGARTGAWAGGGAPLPYDREVAYLRNTEWRNAYIDTGVAASQNIGISITCRAVEFIRDLGSLCGSCSSGLFAAGGMFSVYVVDRNKLIADVGRSSGSFNISDLNVYDTHRYELNFNNSGYFSVFTQDDQRIAYIQKNIGETFDFNIFLFALNTSGRVWSNGSGTFDIVNVKITSGNSLIRDYISVVKDEIGYMYDRCGSICPLTGSSLYGTAGSASFSWGEID